MRKPSPPQGNSNEASWMRNLVRWAASLEMVGVVGGRKIMHPEGGYSLFIEPGRGGGGSMQKFVLTEFPTDSDDYLICRSLTIAEGGAWTVGTTDIYIAKPPDLRTTITAENRAGEIFTFAYSDSATTPPYKIRTITNTSTDPEEVEEQLITPYYVLRDEASTPEIAGSMIMALPVAGGTGVWRTYTNEAEEEVTEQLTLQEVSARAWTRMDETEEEEA